MDQALLSILARNTTEILVFQRILFVTIFLISWFCFSVSAFGGCNSKGMFGATPEDPVMSAVDITLSPVYSSATTSGTSGCQNWDLAMIMKEERLNFIKNQYSELLTQIAQGQGPQLEVWSLLMTCEPKVQIVFNRMLHENYKKSHELLTLADGYINYTSHVIHWIKQHNLLKKNCPLVDLS